MWTGNPPFWGATENDLLIATKEKARLSSISPTVFTSLEKVDRHLLARDPQSRYQSAGELLHDLEILRSDLKIPTTSQMSGRPSLLARPLILAVLILLLSATIGGAFLYDRKGRSTPSSERSSKPDHRRVVAVLPLQNISNDPSQEYFSSGMTEEINGQLSKLASLQLISRAAISQYKDSHVNLQQIGKDLSIGSVVTGSVRQDGRRVRINVELVDTSNEHTIWAEQYDRELKDVFAVQSDIAVRIAAALGAALSQSDRAYLEKRPTENMAAYQLYLESQVLPSNVSKDNLQAIRMLQQAWEMDPQFASALAKVSYRQTFQAYLGDKRYEDLAVGNAHKAIAIDPNLAEAHFALASAYMAKGEVSQARLSFMKALELNPNFTEAMNNYSLEELDSGRADQALYWAARSLRLAPNSANSYYHLAAPLLMLGDNATTLHWLTEGEQNHPNEPRVQIMRSIFDFVDLGKRDEGLRRVRVAIKAWPDDGELEMPLVDLAFIAGDPEAKGHLQHLSQVAPEMSGWVLVESNRLKFADLLLGQGDIRTAMSMVDQAENDANKALHEGSESSTPRLELAAAYVIRGNRQKALEWLDFAYASGARDYRALEIDPFFEKLRTDSHFKGIISRMANDVAQMRERARDQLPEIFVPLHKIENPKTASAATDHSW